MARGALLTGTVGAIIGSITGGIGIVWSIVDIFYIAEILNVIRYHSGLMDLYYIVNKPTAFIFGQIYSRILTPSSGLFFDFSLILAVLLFVSGVLTGVGFYGMYQAGGGKMGVVGLAFGIIGGTAGSLLLILGNEFTAISSLNLIPYSIITVPMPNYLRIFIGFAILGVSFILIGASSIAVREATAHSSAAAAAGTLSIIGGCFFFPYILDWLLLIAGGISTLIAFVLVLSAFIIWTAVFFGSRNV